MARKESFTYPETATLFQLLEQAARRSAVSRAQAFEDFLEMSICALSGGQMEEQYLAVVEKHSKGRRGRRGCESLAELFGAMVGNLESESREPMKDLLGDLFQGAITYGEAGQFLTPMPICRLMAKLNLTDFDPPKDRRPTISDPCCGSGRMLMACAEIHRDAEFHGQDVDIRCVRMTSVNLALRNLTATIVHGNTLILEQRTAYRTGFNIRGFVREILSEEAREASASGDLPGSASTANEDVSVTHRHPPDIQLGLF